MSHDQCACPDCQREAYDNPMAWILFTPSDDIRVEHAAIHAIPDNDIHGHRIDEDGTCGCNPWLDEEADGLLYVHRAFDGREAIIHRTRKPS